MTIENTGRALAPYDEPRELTVVAVLDQVQKIQELMARAMIKGEHYGVIPGTQKPTLLKAGAEKLCLLFRLDPQYDVVSSIEESAFISFTIRCTLYHMVTGQRVGSGLGSCSSRESKYAFRNAARVCPSCGRETIIKGKAGFGGGWICWKAKGGCGDKWPEGADAIEGQAQGKIPAENIWDQHNTILKMSSKRALAAAVLNATAASDIFTQDLEDSPEAGDADVIEAQTAERSTAPHQPTPPVAQQRPATARPAPTPKPAQSGGPHSGGARIPDWSTFWREANRKYPPDHARDGVNEKLGLTPGADIAAYVNKLAERSKTSSADVLDRMIEDLRALPDYEAKPADAAALEWDGSLPA